MAQENVDDPKASGEMYFFAVPLATWRAISDAAMKRNMTSAQALSKAINDFLKDSQVPQPKLLVEQGKEK
jgi:hypothetical protein